MADTQELVKILKKQGSKVKLTPGPSGDRWSITCRSGTFILTTAQMQELHAAKKLNMAGIKELDEKLKNQG
jgi:hypothetical protein